jgi:hypothetical protein
MNVKFYRTSEISPPKDKDIIGIFYDMPNAYLCKWNKEISAWELIPDGLIFKDVKYLVNHPLLWAEKNMIKTNFKFEIINKKQLVDILEKAHKYNIYPSVLFLSDSGYWCFIHGPNYEKKMEEENGLFFVKFKDLNKDTNFIKLVNLLEERCNYMVNTYKNILEDKNFEIYINENLINRI